jgi:hypothetical protein
MRQLPRAQVNALRDDVLHVLTCRRTVALVGETNAGKTHFATNVLVPSLTKRGLRCVYVPTPDGAGPLPLVDVVIVDEVEVLEDEDFLRARSRRTREPYYRDAYLRRVRAAHEWLGSIDVPCVYIVTRNGRREIANLVDRQFQMAWARLPIAWRAFPTDK